MTRNREFVRKGLWAINASLLFVLLLGSIHFIHIRFLTVDVVFYAAIADAVLAAGMACVLLWTGTPFRVLEPFEKSLLAIIWLLAGYGFAISVPTVIDRSLSFYLLEKIDQRGGGIRQDGFEEVFTREYMTEHRLVDVRLTEQLESGTISIDEGCVRLTSRGRSLVRFSRFYRQNLLPRARLLMGEYTDDLTDPFKGSNEITHYRC